MGSAAERQHSVIEPIPLSAGLLFRAVFLSGLRMSYDSQDLSVSANVFLNSFLLKNMP
jgi:hypothetical protein